MSINNCNKCEVHSFSPYLVGEGLRPKLICLPPNTLSVYLGTHLFDFLHFLVETEKICSTTILSEFTPLYE